ncbi:DUF3298 and DUF4163 domain-containing protein [Candidatus Uhrbacteria bacterium]|nr:DUF3298 and DUF4163 domain-containing protein [Candidatus Uhrbacteria bacterium]
MIKRLFAVLLTLPLLAAGCTATQPVSITAPAKPDTSFPGDANAYIAPLKSQINGQDFSINLVRLGDRLSGTFESVSGTELLTGGVMGSPTGTSQIELRFYSRPLWEDTAVFTGQWNAGRLSGTWSASDGTQKEVSFDLDNPAGMTPLDVRLVEATQKDDSNIERCYFSMAYPVVKGNGVIAASMNRELEKAFGLENASGTRQTIDEKKESFFASCLPEITEQIQFMGEGAETTATLGYSDDTSFTIELNEKDILSLSAEGYFYSGGAHGMPWITSVNLDAKTGKPLVLSDIIRSDKLQHVQRMIAIRALSEFNESLFEQSRADFEKRAADESELAPDLQKRLYGNNTNFLIARSGITFFWNVYEITPYVAGQPQIFFPYEDIEEYINTDGPLGRLLK